MNKIIVLFVFMGVVTSGCMAADRAALGKGVRSGNELAVQLGEAYLKAFDPFLFSPHERGVNYSKSHLPRLEAVSAIVQHFGDNGFDCMANVAFRADGIERISLAEYRMSPASWISEDPGARRVVLSIASAVMVVNDFTESLDGGSSWRLCRELPGDTRSLREIIASLRRHRLVLEEHHYLRPRIDELEAEIFKADLTGLTRKNV